MEVSAHESYRDRTFIPLTFSSANCNANPGFKPVASGGDGAVTQTWFVGYDPTLKVYNDIGHSICVLISLLSLDRDREPPRNCGREDVRFT